MFQQYQGLLPILGHKTMFPCKPKSLPCIPLVFPFLAVQGRVLFPILKHSNTFLFHTKLSHNSHTLSIPKFLPNFRNKNNLFLTNPCCARERVLSYFLAFSYLITIYFSLLSYFRMFLGLMAKWARKCILRLFGAVLGMDWIA